MKNSVIIFAIILIGAVPPLAAVPVQALPDSYITFRDAVYLQNSDLLGTMRLYAEVKHDIENTLTGVDKFLALSRCEYLMGITFRAAGRNNEAAAFFEQGIAYAEESLEIRATSEGYRFLGTNISFLCEVRPAFGLKNYNKIEKNAQQALALNPDNLMAKYLIAAFYVIAPWPASNVRKGSELLQEITSENYLTLDKEDLFNLYLMLQVACIKQKQQKEAQVWEEKAKALYATNNFIALLVK